eukprot:NODE_3721_length_1996_cov_3.692884.p2 GENE.NODE_3721_length_1996_cov_3.692884~~NODE_3721_length_1996_cov_3.692884.p2  ORF type:complete len:287 (-),score=73.59 NODE_3721_length_1996_cov_3.692884:94-954(-)
MVPRADAVDSRMFQWKQAGPVCARVCEEIGRAATTWFSAAAHLQHTWVDLRTLILSLAAIRIGTGRRHQIRTHITHIGHPTVLDAKYADVSVFDAEAEQLHLRLEGAPAPLHSRRFQSVYPPHMGVDAEQLNPALLELTGREVPPVPPSLLPALPQKAAPSDDASGPWAWSRSGPCSRAARRTDAEGRDKDRCMVCGVFGHWSRECPNGGKDRCLVCGQRGHRARHCPEGGDICLFCGNVGHQQKECPRLRLGAEAWTPLCFDFKTERRCKFGASCPFSHNIPPAV